MSHRSQSKLVTDGPKIRLMRDLAGYTLRRFAQEVGTDPAHLSRIERGTRQPGIQVRNSIARVLGVDVSEIAQLPDHQRQAA